jgi:hypothetical protein
MMSLNELFVSKRLHRAAALFLCGVAVLFVFALASCEADLAPMPSAFTLIH